MMESLEGRFENVYKENHHFLNTNTFVICAMFAPKKPQYDQHADRLIKSCEKFGLPYSIYKVPDVHKSLHPSGTGDLSFTRTNLIYFNLMRFPDKNILCLDIDMFFMDYPEVIAELSNAGYDFAIYNWLNDLHNEAYVPINSNELQNKEPDYYIYAFSIDLFSDEQLLCSGGVQFYRNSLEAKHLLETWQTFIAHNGEIAEDRCLDFVYNNFILHKRQIKPFWLDKSYIRLRWWPHIKPVIIHPEWTSASRERKYHPDVIDNYQRVYDEKCRIKDSNFIFPPAHIIDTKNRLLLKVINDQIVDSSPLRENFWIYPEDVGLV